MGVGDCFVSIAGNQTAAAEIQTRVSVMAFSSLFLGFPRQIIGE
jgi:hypothetical protein